MCQKIISVMLRPRLFDSNQQELKGIKWNQMESKGIKWNHQESTGIKWNQIESKNINNFFLHKNHILKK
jgi:hypothetical protein